MSVEAPHTVEETPAVTEKTLPTTTPTETTHIADETPAAETSDITATPAVAEGALIEPTQELKKGETVVEATPASEGVLGYKEPGFLKQLRFVKHFFWFNDEPSSAESLAPSARTEKSKISHEQSAWARETGQGLLFYSKRAEDKTNPSGIISLHDASNVAKEGTNVFSMKIGQHYHRFEAATSAERDGWVVAVQKKLEEAKAMKDDITGRDSYKKNLDEYTKGPVLVGAAAAAKTSRSERSKSKEAKKTLDTNTTTATAEPTPAAAVTDNVDATSEDKINHQAAKKDRSQSRKRASIFGTLRAKKDEREEQKEVKKEEKEVAKEHKAEEKKEEKLEKKAEHDHEEHRGLEGAEAATAATAIPAAAVATDRKHEEKEEEKTGTTTPTDKKAKRSSVFGGLFGKKGVTSPTSEKTEKDVGPTPLTNDSEIPPVSETAPKIVEPIENQPIDTAAVTAPVDTVQTPAPTDESTKELGATTPAATETATTPKTEKKGGLLGFIKSKKDKDESKDVKDLKEDKTTEPLTETTPAVPATTTGTETNEPVTDTTSSSPAKDETQAREKRRTSLFDKGQLQGKLGGLFRKPSKAVRSEEPKDAEVTDSTPTTNNVDAPTTDATATGTSAIEPHHTATDATESALPSEPHISGADAVTTAPEVKASA